MKPPTTPDPDREGEAISWHVYEILREKGLAEKIPHIAMPMTLAMALGMPLWLKVMKRVDKHRAWSAAAVGMIGMLCLVPAMPSGAGALVPMVAVMSGFGFFLGLSSIALPSLLADLVDYDIWKNGKDRAAIFFSFQALVTKLNQGVGGAIALFIPTLFGFSGKGEITGAAELGLKLAFVGWPCVLLIPMIWLAWRYPLDRRAQVPPPRAPARRTGCLWRGPALRPPSPAGAPVRMNSPSSSTPVAAAPPSTRTVIPVSPDDAVKSAAGTAAKPLPTTVP